MDAAPPDATAAPNVAGIRVENCYVFKSRLQEYVQKAGLPSPEYQTIKEGPSHEPVFKSTVLVNGTVYESLPGFFARKAAEQSAAEVALMEIGKTAPLPDNKTIPALQETGLCKNLLQEYAQKMNYAIPSYICTKLASGIAPFSCTIEIGGIQYIGAAARTKKEAEIKAARTALLAIQGQSEGCANAATKYIVVPGKRQGKETEKKAIETPKSLKVKKGGSRNKRNRRKLINTRYRKGKPVDVGKDEARVVGDAHSSDVLMQPTINTSMLLSHDEATRIEQDSSTDITMVQDGEDNVKQEPHYALPPGEESTRVGPNPPRDAAMVQPDEEALSVKQEPHSALPCGEEVTRVEPNPPRDAAMVQPNEEDLSVKQEPHSALPHGEEVTRVEPNPPRDAAMVQPNEKDLSVKQEPLSALPPGEEVTRVEPKPPRDAAMVQPNEEVRNVKQEELSGTTMLQPNESLCNSAMMQPIAEATNMKEDAPINAAVTQL